MLSCLGGVVFRPAGMGVRYYRDALVFLKQVILQPILNYLSNSLKMF